MKRYTVNRCGKWIIPKNQLSEAAEKLARYENSGLDPEKIYEMDRLYTEKCAELNCVKAEHDRKKAEVMIFLDWLDGQIMDDPIKMIREKLEEVL